MNIVTLTDRLQKLIELHFTFEFKMLEVVTIYTQSSVMQTVQSVLKKTQIEYTNYFWNSNIEAAQHFINLEKLFQQQKVVILHMTQDQLVQDGNNFLNWKNRFNLRPFDHSSTPGIIVVIQVSNTIKFPLRLANSMSSVILNWNVEF